MYIVIEYFSIWLIFFWLRVLVKLFNLKYYLITLWFQNPASCCLPVRYAATIEKIDYDKEQVLIHYRQWSRRHDEWFQWNSPYLRPLERLGLRRRGLNQTCASTVWHTNYVPTVGRVIFMQSWQEHALCWWLDLFGVCLLDTWFDQMYLDSLSLPCTFRVRFNSYQFGSSVFTATCMESLKGALFIARAEIHVRFISAREAFVFEVCSLWTHTSNRGWKVTEAGRWAL